MQKISLIIIFLLLLLFMGSAVGLAQQHLGSVERYSADNTHQSHGGIYTLHSNYHNLRLAEQNHIQSASTSVMAGGDYVLETRHSWPDSQISQKETEEVLTAVVTHTHSVNPGAFLYDEDSTDITMNIYYGLRWAADPNERGGFYMSRPADWDGASPVKVRLTFALGSGDAGTVNWRLRLNSYSPNSGEWLTNPAARDADEILLFNSGSSLRIYEQTFTLQPEDFNDEPYWSFFFTRGDGTNGETFTGNLYVMGADVFYGALPGTDFIYLPIVVR